MIRSRQMQKLIIANWKSNKSASQAEAWLAEAGKLLGGTEMKGITPVLAPAFPLLPVVNEAVKKLGWKLAVQDLSPFPAGSYTGAVSAVNLRNLPVKYAILGHSERRRYFHETAQEVARKVEQAVDATITPIICVDEHSIETQVSALNAELAERCVVAYEPVGAIGTGNSATLAQVKQFQATVKRLFGSVPFLYGGSVDELDINEYLLATDGVIIGTASLNAKQFIDILRTAQGTTVAET